jgi:hypothetical protein
MKPSRVGPDACDDVRILHQETRHRRKEMAEEGGFSCAPRCGQDERREVAHSSHEFVLENARHVKAD